MNNNLISLDERIEELLSQLVTEGLSNDEQREFDQIDWCDLGTSPDAEISRFEQAAAALAVAFDELGDDDDDSLPAKLQVRLANDAKPFLENNRQNLAEGTIQPATLPTSSMAPPSWREALAILAAAACIAMLLFNWYATPGKSGPSSPDLQMAMLVKSNPADLVRADWTPVQDKTRAAKSSGAIRNRKVTWSLKGYRLTTRVKNSISSGFSIPTPGNLTLLMAGFSTSVPAAK